MVGQDPVHEPSLPVGDIGQQQVLLGSEADAAADGLDDAAERAPQPAVLAVPDATVLNEHAQERASLALLVPPEMVRDIRHLNGGGRRERTTELPLHLLAEPVEPLFVEEILETRMAPVAAVAVIPLGLPAGLGHLPDLARPGEAPPVSRPRGGARIPSG